MARSERFWIQVYNLFNPDEVLVGERGKALYYEREYSPLPSMELDFRPAMTPLRPPVAFLTGHRGSGKSSLLLRFLEQCKEHYFVVYFDIDHNLDSHKTTHIDLLYLLGATVFQVASREGLRPDVQHLQELAASVYTLTYTEKEKVKEEALNVVELAKGLICFGASMLGAELGKNLAEALLKPFTFSTGVSEDIARKRDIEPQAQIILMNVNLILADVQTLANKPVLVVVDGLDKLPRLAQAQHLFLESRALRGPLCRMVYTVPLPIFSDPRFVQVEEECRSYLLPNIKLYERTDDQQRYAPGYAALREVVSKRLHLANLTPEDLFEPEALDMLMFKSGGLIRWFIGLVAEACKYAERLHLNNVDRQAAQAAVEDRAAHTGGRLTREMIRELQEVRRDKRPSGSKESQELLQGLLIVAYRNRRTWYDAHPLIWDEL